MSAIRGTVFLVSGETFADSVIGATIAARTSSALLLTTSTVLPDATAKELAALKPARVVVLGGTEAISAGVAAATPAFFMYDIGCQELRDLAWHQSHHPVGRARRTIE